MKIGVSTVPCGKTRLPRRAELWESVERTVKDTGERGEIGQNPTRAKPKQPSRVPGKIFHFSRNISPLAEFIQMIPVNFPENGNFSE